MNLGIDYTGNKGFRLLSIYERLNKGEVVEKAQLAESFGVTLKTIQRDIDDLRAYLAETHFEEGEVSIKYDKVRNGYYLVRFEREWLWDKKGKISKAGSCNVFRILFLPNSFYGRWK